MSRLRWRVIAITALFVCLLMFAWPQIWTSGLTNMAFTELHRWLLSSDIGVTERCIHFPKSADWLVEASSSVSSASRREYLEGFIERMQVSDPCRVDELFALAAGSAGADLDRRSWQTSWFVEEASAYALKNSPGFHSLEVDIDPAWHLVGFASDSMASPFGVTRLVLLWCHRIGGDSKVSGSILAEAGSCSYVAQLLNERSLLLNAGFEMVGSTEKFDIAPGPYKEIYSNAGTRTTLVIVERQGVQTLALEVRNNPGQYGGVGSPVIRVEANKPYLLAGWVKSVGGNPRFGAVWRGEAVPPWTYSWLEVPEASAGQVISGIVWPHPDATTTSLRLLNFKSGGIVYFDDILFLPIEPPSTSVGSQFIASPGIEIGQDAARDPNVITRTQVD